MQKFKSIFLIDDDDISNFLCEETIKSSNITNEVYAFSNADDALDQLNQTNESELPDVIFLDINMHGTDGWEFLEHLHKIQARFSKQINVIILSSSNFQLDIQKSREFIEVTDYIAKPLTQNVLDSILQRYSQKTVSQSNCP